jgi:hypothetical protein
MNENMVNNCVTAKMREVQADVGNNEQASLWNLRDPRAWETAATICRFGPEGHIPRLTLVDRLWVR